MYNKPKIVGQDSPVIAYGFKDKTFKPKDEVMFTGTTKDSQGKAAHKDMIKIVQLYPDGRLVAKNLRNGAYFNTTTQFIFKEDPFSLNEMYDTLSIRPNVYVEIKDKGKMYVDQVDKTGQNPDNPFHHLAIYVKKDPSKDTKGEWVTWEQMRYQYPENEEPEKNKELTNIMKEAKNKKLTFDKKEKHGPTPEHYFKKFNVGGEERKQDKDIVPSPFTRPSKRSADSEELGNPKEEQFSGEDNATLHPSVNNSNRTKPSFSGKMPKAGQFGPPTLNKDRNNLSNFMPGKEQGIENKCPNCNSDNVQPDETIQDMNKCQDCGNSFTSGDLKEAAKITGVLKIWADKAKDIAKTMFSDKTFNKLTDAEKTKAYIAADAKKKQKRLQGPMKMKKSGDIDYENEEN